MYLIVTSDMGFYKWIVSQCTCTTWRSVLKTDIVITSSPYTHTHFLTSLSAYGFTCLADRYSITFVMKLYD